MIGLIRFAHVHRSLVGIRIDRNGFDIELMTGSDHPYSDLTPVGNEYFREQRQSIRLALVERTARGRRTPHRGKPTNSAHWPTTRRVIHCRLATVLTPPVAGDL